MALTYEDVKNWGFISNQITASLIDRNGEVLWLCLPTFESGAVIAYLLDENSGGRFYLKPSQQFISSQKYTAPNVLTTEFKTDEGTAEVTDFLVPGKNMLIRNMKSDIELEFRMNPVFNFGNSQINKWERDGLFIFDDKKSGGRLIVKIDHNNIKRVDDQTFRIGKGDGRIILSYYESSALSELSAEKDSLKNVSGYLEIATKKWETKLRNKSFNSLVSDDDRLSMLFKTSVSTILGMVYSLTGAIIAAPTTSLPETPGGNRNWDYRYMWVRDSSMMTSALCDVGFTTQSRRTIEFLFNLIDYSSKPFYTMYRINGNKMYGERFVENLKGFMGSKPIRVGNRATNQLQLDVEGEFLDALYHYFLKTKDVEFIKSNIKAVEYIADWVSKNWQLNDSGIWEGVEDMDHTHSKVMMWVALDRAAKLVEASGGKDVWTDTRQEIKDWVYANCTGGGYFNTYPDSGVLDATILTFLIYGFLDKEDKVFLNSLKRLEKTLIKEGFVYRYLNDSMGEERQAFSLCSTWLSSVYGRISRTNDAKKVLSDLAAVSGPLGLIGEDVDVKSKIFTGNFPQGFAHAGYIRAFMDLNADRSVYYP